MRFSKKPLLFSRTGTVVCLAILALGSGAWAIAAADASVDFNRDIRPILSDNCFACHGPDQNQRKANLRLDTKDGAFKPAKSGDFAIVPGDLAKSKLLERVTSTDPDEVMPPPKSDKKLTARQIELLKTWIATGAKWQGHWAFDAPQRPPVPPAKDAMWPRNEIDNFTYARMEKEKLQPSPVAEKTTLIRRATLDATGLPPTPQEVDAFLADTDPQGYDKLVDRLLEAPAYGEQMARYWLDAARYADSHGYHIDSERSMWKYREWVINAFNQNKPFDQFTVEQLAGDLLPEKSVPEKIASGYIRCNMSTGEGGAITEEYQAKYTFDRVETTSTIWLGLTLTCARCHSHKYDPITHKEYFGIYALFNTLDEAVMDGNKPNPDPFIKVPSRAQQDRLEWLKGEIKTGQSDIERPLPDLDRPQGTWEKTWRERLTAGWTTLAAAEAKSTGGAELKILEDQTILAEGTNPATDVHEITIKPAAGVLAALRLETLPHESLPQKSAARADDGGFRLSEFEAEIVYPDAEGKPGKPEKVKFAQALADSAREGNDIAKAIDGKAETGWQADPAAMVEPHAALFLPGEAITLKENATLRLRLRYEASANKRALGHFRLAAAQNNELATFLAPPKPKPWQVIGPFKTASLQQGLTNAFDPELDIDLKKTYPGARDEIKWQAKPDFEDGKNNLLVADLHGIHGAYYLYRTVKASKARPMELSVRADDLFKLWVNDSLVLERTETEKVGDGPLKVTVNLTNGVNKFLLKIVTLQGAAYFTFKKDSDDLDSVPADIAALFAATKTFNPVQQTTVRNFYRRLHSPEFKQRFDQVAKWREENDSIEKAIPTTMVAKEMEKPRETFMLMRGEYDKKGDGVQPGLPAILPPWPAGAPTNRLGFAKWLVDPGHPLTARVTVNRFWQHYFGVGLVKTAEDFGVQGEQPSHPELLDWLATEFMRSGWDIKRIHKLIMTSATYRQTSRLTPELRTRDPENRLLARGPRFRMDAEMVRDNALAISGLLLRSQGGQSVKPYEPPGLWEAVSFNNSQKYVPDTGPGQYRRSMYTYWKRQSPPPNMLIFDAPTREYCSVRRSRSNTPLQALVLLNDPQFVDASRSFAHRVLLEGGKTDRERLLYAFRLATARTPDDGEIKVLEDVLSAQLAAFRAQPDAVKKLLAAASFQPSESVDKTELAAWTTIASMLLNLDETVTKG